HYNLLIVHEVIERELPASSVLQPLLADLVATYMKIPDFTGHAFEILGLVDKDVSCLVIVIDYKLGKALFHNIFPNHRITGYELAEIRAFHQMQGHQLLTEETE